jgi:alkanesulfonate monooxygenase SsuD/methylene tetrahydromethanopterin reductase-like flavin-dependent oxidoreductase (luciferase family)
MATEYAGRADVLTAFAAVAAQTERIRLGSAVIPTYPRHPLVMSQQALAVHDIAPGRLRLGIGPSHRFYMEGVYGLQQPSPLLHLKEYLHIMRGLLWEGSIDHHGTFFNAAYTLPRTAQVPLLISTMGLKAFRLAGEIADGAITSTCPLPYLLNQALPALRAGAEERSRPAPPVIALVSVALSTDTAAVLAAIRQQVQGMTRLDAYARMFVKAGFAGAVDGDEADLDALARSLVISGDEVTVRQLIQEWLASGLDELLLALVPIADGERERKQLLHLIGSLEA